MNTSSNFYSENAGDFISRTAELDVSSLYAEVLPLIPESGSILDAGCGSGRDARYFINRGYRVHAFDASKEIADHASNLIGQDVENTTFESFDTETIFDGIWACASLLHISPQKLPENIKNLACFLKTGGVFYMSFKYGQGVRMRGSRRFTDMDKSSIEKLGTQLPFLTLNKSWITGDIRPGRIGEKWMNALWIKK